jgi:phenylacetate-CoA ligase
MMINKAKFFLYHIYGKLAKNSNVIKAEAEILRFEDLDDKAKQIIRTEKLLTILNRAYMEVPFYRELFDRNDLKFPDVQSLVNFEKIPILTKKIIRENFENIKNIHINKKRWLPNKTSGSTGNPLIFITDQEYQDIKLGLRNFQFLINGKRTSDWLIKIWGTSFYEFEKGGDWKHKIGNWLSNRVELNSNFLNKEIMDSFINVIKSKDSVFIESYAQSAYELAKYINQNGIEINNVTAITATVSTLYNFMRDEIEKAFNCRVYNRYGSRETSVIAFERNHRDGLRVSTSQYIVEVLNQKGQHCKSGEEGDIVITNFSNFAFPFIRYRIGDRAVVKELEDNPVVSCLSLETISGRISDVFVNEDGSMVDSQYFAHVVGQSINSGWIEKMQIVQLEYKKVQIKIVKTDKLLNPETEIQLMRKAIQTVMGLHCQVDFNFVDQIEASQTGKYQYVKSLINKK